MLTALPPAEWNFDMAAHLCQRAGFGGEPSEIESLAKKGLPAAVGYFLNPPSDSTPPPPWTDLDTVLRTQERRKELQAEKRLASDPVARQNFGRQIQQEIQQQFGDLQHWWINRMVQTPAPLVEKMTLFWHGHFATSGEKVHHAYFMWRQNETFRQNALGNFGQLTKEISRDPAMLIWLDLRGSKKEHPNENFARELMELFMLGEGHYSETDVKESARAFTGYRINNQTQSFRFVPQQFDASEKTFLQRTGPWNGDQTIDLILAQRQCARFLAGKLWQFFGSLDPAPALVDALAGNLQENGYELKPFLRTLFSCEEFYHERVRKNQIKSPIQFMVESSRTLRLPVPPAPILRPVFSQLGQIPFYPPNVKGWDGGFSWINTATLQFRYKLARQLVNGMMAGQIGVPVPKAPPPPATGPGLAKNNPGPAGAPQAKSVEQYLASMKGASSGQPWPEENMGEMDPAMAGTMSSMAPPRPATPVPLTAPLPTNRLLTAEDRAHPDVVVKKLLTRVYQSKPAPGAIAAFQKVAATNLVPLNDRSIRDLVVLMMTTPEYQLC